LNTDFWPSMSIHRVDDFITNKAFIWLPFFAIIHSISCKLQLFFIIFFC
jgi:hypothetical protein